jgi:glucan phosphoethanolaminetransferase (alkaline phosphatase superfamily)
MPKLNIREIVIVAALFMPFGLLLIYLIVFRPFYYKYWLILCALILTVIQYFAGRFAYRYDYDARYLAEYIRKQNE